MKHSEAEALRTGLDAATVVGGRSGSYNHERGFDNMKIVSGRPDIHRTTKKANGYPIYPRRRKFEGLADITVINMNLFRFNIEGKIEQEMQPPLGLLYLISVLERSGYVVDYIDHQIYDLDYHGKDPFNLIDVVTSFGHVANIIGLGCMANLLPFTILVAKELKSRYPDKVIILGGVGPFGVEELILENFPWIDLVVRGEAEMTILQIMEAISKKKDFENVLGISYRSYDGIVVRNGDQPRIQDLDALPFPAYHRLNINRYDAYSIITNRGCPYPCTFCSVAPIWNHRTFFRSHKNIISEMRALYETFGINRVLFQNEFFYMDERRMIEFCDRLRKSRLPVTWKCFGRVNLVTEKAMRRMAEAGCIQIRFGVESGSDRILQKINKGFHFKDALEAVEKALEIFDSVETFFMWGFPFEKIEDFNQTAAQMERFRNMGVNVSPSLLSFLPQTQIYKEYLAGHYLGRLTLRPELVPIFVVSGFEVIGEHNTVPEQYQIYYDLIGEYPEIFPGFYVFDYEENIEPKFQVLRSMGFA